MDWQVTLTVTLDRELTDEQLADLADAATLPDAALAVDADQLSATLTVAGADTPAAAIGHGYDVLGRALDWQLRGWTEAEAVTVAEADRRLAEPTIPALVSGVEAAAILGVSRQRVHQLAADNPAFPPPVARLASGSVWLQAAVEAFARGWTRKPGRPARAAR